MQKGLQKLAKLETKSALSALKLSLIFSREISQAFQNSSDEVESHLKSRPSKRISYYLILNVNLKLPQEHYDMQ